MPAHAFDERIGQDEDACATLTTSCANAGPADQRLIPQAHPCARALPGGPVGIGEGFKYDEATLELAGIDEGPGIRAKLARKEDGAAGA